MSAEYLVASFFGMWLFVWPYLMGLWLPVAWYNTWLSFAILLGGWALPFLVLLVVGIWLAVKLDE